jgi:hypothetical protein
MDNKTNLTYSEVIYLFANKAVSERSRLVNYDTHASGEKISIKPLSHKMVTAALAYLVEKNYLSLSVKEVKKLIFLSGKEAFGKKLKDAGSDITGIEKVLLNNFKNETEVHKAVYWLLYDDESSPWGQVVVISKNSLVEKGFLFIEKERKNIFSAKRYLYDENKIKEIIPLYEEAEKKLTEFSAKTESYKLVENAVQKGIAARREQSSSDD